VITGELLQLCFWRIDGGATGSFLHHHIDEEQLGIIVRGKLDFRIGEPSDETRVVLEPGEVYLAPRSIWHGDSVFVVTTSSTRCGSRRLRSRERTCAMADGSTAPDWRLAVDIGGTFTDVVLIDAPAAG